MNIDVSKINKKYDFFVTKLSTITDPSDNSVIFCNEKYFKLYGENLEKVKNCVIFLPKSCKKKEYNNNLCFFVDNPRLSFAKFVNENLEKIDPYISENAKIGENVKIGKDCLIEDFTVIEGNVRIGDKCIIKSGTKIYGDIIIGNNCIIENNVVIGSTALAYEFDKELAIFYPVPQFGGVLIKDNVSIGPNTTIARGAIVDTIIGEGCKIDANCYISHNCNLSESILIVGSTLLMGSITVGKNSYISGNVTVIDNITIGQNVFIGMGAVVNNNIEDNKKVKGVPAKEFN